jgi:lipopolysaccharide transport system ATP-binding protein
MLALQVENLSKVYRLGQYNTASALQGIRRKFSKSQTQIVNNDRTQVANAELVYALQNINFDVPQGQVLGIIGRNGAGKSTLLKLLSRVTAPSTGSIKIKGRMASLLEVGTGFHPDLTGLENIYLNGAILGMNKAEIKSKLEEIVDFSGVRQYIDTPVKRYSSGMQVRLAFAVAAHLDPDIMIVDEVLAVGDADFQEKCIGKMKNVSGQGRTVLFVSHSMGTIRSLCTRGILLKNGEMNFDGSVEDCIDGYLKSAMLVGEDGRVPEGMSTLNNGMGRITKVGMFSSAGLVEKIARFKSDLNFELQFQSDAYQGPILIGIQVKNVHNEKIVDYVNEYDNAELNMEKGLNNFKISLNNPFLPGKYYVDVTVALPNGEAIDSLENAIEFTASNLGATLEFNYTSNVVNGYVSGSASWLMK